MRSQEPKVLDPLNSRERKIYTIQTLEKILTFFKDQEQQVFNECISLEKLFKNSLPTRHMATNQLQSLKEKERAKQADPLGEKKPQMIIDPKLDTHIKSLIEQAETTLQTIEDPEKPRPVVKATLQPYLEKTDAYAKKRQSLLNKALNPSQKGVVAPTGNKGISSNKMPPAGSKPGAVAVRKGGPAGSSSSSGRGSSVGPQSKRLSGNNKLEKKASVDTEALPKQNGITLGTDNNFSLAKKEEKHLSKNLNLNKKDDIKPRRSRRQ